jgi:hypothetical protein
VGEKPRITADNFALARELAGWKGYISRVWDEIEIVKFDLKGLENNVFRSGHNYSTEIILDIKDIPVENVGVELVVTRQLKNGEHAFFSSRSSNMSTGRRDGSYTALISNRRWPALSSTESVSTPGTVNYLTGRISAC